jgi:hypothetical protein
MQEYNMEFNISKKNKGQKQVVNSSSILRSSVMYDHYNSAEHITWETSSNGNTFLLHYCWVKKELSHICTIRCTLLAQLTKEF